MPTDPAPIDPGSSPSVITSAYDPAGRVVPTGPRTVTYSSYPGARSPESVAWVTYDAGGRVIARGGPAPGTGEPPPDEPHVVG